MNTCVSQRSGALHLTQKVDYGLIILVALAKNEQMSIKKIAEQSRVSFLFLQKIAGLLQKAGLIKATRGKFGGYKLSKTTDQINLKEVIEALDGPIALTPCLKDENNPGCKHVSYCMVRPGLSKLNMEIQSQIVNKTLDYIICQ